MNNKASNKRRIEEHINSSLGFFYEVDKTIVEANTQFQKAELVETESLGRVMLLDGITQVSEKWEYRYHETLVHPALLSHPNPKDVLIIGGGDGGTLREVVKYKNLCNIDFVELDKDVVTFSKEHLGQVYRDAFLDKRVNFIFCDGRKYVEDTDKKYDVIIMDMTDPDGPARFLYTKEFFEKVKAIFKNEDAIFCMHGESPCARPLAFLCIQNTLKAVFKKLSCALAFVPMYGTLWSFRFASDKTCPEALSKTELQSLIETRLVSKPIFTNEKMWDAIFAPDPIIFEASQKIKDSNTIITDNAPDFPDTFSV